MDRETICRQLGDVPLDLTVELDRVALPAARAWRLKAGDVLRLDKLAGKAMAVRVNGAAIAEGEITTSGPQSDTRAVRLINMTRGPHAEEPA